MVTTDKVQKSHPIRSDFSMLTRLTKYNGDVPEKALPENSFSIFSIERTLTYLLSTHQFTNYLHTSTMSQQLNQEIELRRSSRTRNSNRKSYSDYFSDDDMLTEHDDDIEEEEDLEEEEEYQDARDEEYIQKEQEELARKIAEEKAKLETLKKQEEVDNIIIETDLETEEKKIINVHSG